MRGKVDERKYSFPYCPECWSDDQLKQGNGEDTPLLYCDRCGIGWGQERNKLREKLAELAHEQWSGWMHYLFSKGIFNDDGTWTMPAWAVKCWLTQTATTYSELSESEQDSDRNEADKFLAVIRVGEKNE